MACFATEQAMKTTADAEKAPGSIPTPSRSTNSLYAISISGVIGELRIRFPVAL